MTQPFSEALASLPAPLAQALVEVVEQPFTGYLNHTQRQALEQRSGLSGNELLLALLPLAADLAQAPVSHFKVGAIAVGHSDDLYFGANLELQGQTLFHSVHAEQAAISHAWLAGEPELKAIVINASPCGHCRQFMNELQHASALQVVLPEQGSQDLHHYLPYAFGPADLGVETGLMADRVKPLQIQGGDAVVQLACEQAAASYAPYSLSPAAVVLQTRDGRQFAGRYAENAAFNPSLPPMQMALSAMALAKVPFSEIQRAVLLQLEGAQIDQSHAATAALSAVSEVALEVALARPA
ncbi:cytidine deaminase [Ferrimonas marina]|uniref:Cytidine deaminase n=1 Tax=Ferrimonas marina TaxID=299255 RepID=A0A1M5R7X1_9GAMM|nr:cytidine deaminase [Ferrimonas marina]SHH22126.1 cytidine deaminase [Ferrimonas marina]